MLLFYHGKCPKRWTNAGIKSKKLCSHKYYLFYYTVNIGDFQGLPLVAFLKFYLLRCFVKNLCFPLLYIQKTGNEPSRLHSAAFLLSEKRKGGLKSMLLKITPKQRTKINTLVRRSCCNCCKGNCLLLDDGAEAKCVQLISRYGIYCNYF